MHCFRAKYPLAHVSRLIELFGRSILCGYDIGCGFTATANRSMKVGPLVQEHDFTFCVVGSFHGHAHGRLCQLKFHPLFVEGAGLEDFEGNERTFSEANEMAGSTRHSSRFHRAQQLSRGFASHNRDKFGKLCTC